MLSRWLYSVLLPEGGFPSSYPAYIHWVEPRQLRRVRTVAIARDASAAKDKLKKEGHPVEET